MKQGVILIAILFISINAFATISLENLNSTLSNTLAIKNSKSYLQSQSVIRFYAGKDFTRISPITLLPPQFMTNYA
jgi:hypothetical protein